MAAKRMTANRLNMVSLAIENYRLGLQDNISALEDAIDDGEERNTDDAQELRQARKELDDLDIAEDIIMQTFIKGRKTRIF